MGRPKQLLKMIQEILDDAEYEGDVEDLVEKIVVDYISEKSTKGREEQSG